MKYKYCPVNEDNPIALVEELCKGYEMISEIDNIRAKLVDACASKRRAKRLFREAAKMLKELREKVLTE